MFDFLVCNLLCVTLLVPRTLKWDLDICQIYVPLRHIHLHIQIFSSWDFRAEYLRKIITCSPNLQHLLLLYANMKFCSLIDFEYS